MKKFDFVIPLKASESIWGDNNELKYLLRSVEKNFPVNRVIIVSDRLPAWINPEMVVHLQANDPYLHHKDANLILKIMMASKMEGITSTFYWSCDDHVILRQPMARELKPFFISELKNELSWWWSGIWKQAMKRTMELLESRGKTTFHYDVHIPQPIEAAKFSRVMDMELKENERYCINTLYFNQVLRNHAHIGILKATFEQPVTEKHQIETTCYNRLFLGYNDGGLTSQLQNFIVNKFPNPSKYEK